MCSNQLLLYLSVYLPAYTIKPTSYRATAITPAIFIPSQVSFGMKAIHLQMVDLRVTNGQLSSCTLKPLNSKIL